MSEGFVEIADAFTDEGQQEVNTFIKSSTHRILMMIQSPSKTPAQPSKLIMNVCLSCIHYIFILFIEKRI